MKFSKVINSTKGMFCGILVWALIYGILRLLHSVEVLKPLWGALKLLLLVFGPVALYPPVLWVVLRYQLPPLSSRYIRKNWPLWIPGLVVACLPSIDILILGKRLTRLITG